MKGIEEFNKMALKTHPLEVCGLVSLDGNEWHIYPVKTLPKDFDGDGYPEGFTPDKNDWRKKKKELVERGESIIGIIHSHPLLEDDKDASLEHRISTIEELKHPSDVDLKYQRMFKHTIQGIVVVSKKEVLGMRFHDVNDEDVEIDTCPLCMKKL